jgi:hypothetical protein
MTYRAEISRYHPACLAMLIDQSTSMGSRIEGGRTKAAFLADVINKTLYTLITTCSKADGVRDYFHVGVIAYSGVGAMNGFSGAIAGSNILRPISEIADHPARIEHRQQRIARLPTSDDAFDEAVGKRMVKFPIWFEPRSRGKTSMCAGLRLATEIIGEWCRRHQSSFPPIVLHVSDGHPTDGDPEPLADILKGLATEDGQALLFNLHVDLRELGEITFPNDERTLPDKYARKLFRMSSLLLPPLIAVAGSRGFRMYTGARGFMYNAGPERIVDFFDIGTRPNLKAGLYEQ